MKPEPPAFALSCVWNKTRTTENLILMSTNINFQQNTFGWVRIRKGFIRQLIWSMGLKWAAYKTRKKIRYSATLQWRHNGRDGVSNHQPHDCLLNRLFRRRSKKTSKLRVTGLCAGNSLVTSEFPAQMASDAENVSIWWSHHDICSCW